MKLISLWEPWSTLMALNKKRIETRSWDTQYRGPLAIQSAKGGLSQKALWETCASKHFINALWDGKEFQCLSPGHIVAVVNLIDCLPMEAFRCVAGLFEDYPELDTPQERAFGNYAAFDQESGRRRWGWVTENCFRLPEPIPFKARQRLNDVPAAVIAQIEAQGWRATA